MAYDITRRTGFGLKRVKWLCFVMHSIYPYQILKSSLSVHTYINEPSAVNFPGHSLAVISRIYCEAPQGKKTYHEHSMEGINRIEVSYIIHKTFIIWTFTKCNLLWLRVLMINGCFRCLHIRIFLYIANRMLNYYSASSGNWHLVRLTFFPPKLFPTRELEGGDSTQVKSERDQTCHP